MHSTRSERMHHTAGFTLLELVITVAVLAILAAVALPSFRDTIERNRMTTLSNDLIAALALARGEAIRRNTTSMFCASNADQNACGADWADGWLVWVDTDGDDAQDADEVIRVGRFNERDTVTADDTSMQFNARGLRSDPDDGNPFNLDVQPSDCSAQMLRREVDVRPTGSTSVSMEMCV